MRRPLAIVAATGGSAGTVLAYLFFVRTAAGQRLDARLGSDHGMTEATGVLAAYDRYAVAVEVVATLVVLAVAAARHRLRRGGLSAALPLGVVTVANIAQHLLTRPVEYPGGSAHNSFPSGHVALAAATVIAFVLVVPARFGPLVAAVGSVPVTLVLGATIAAGWHRFSDGLGAVLLAIAAGGLVVLLSPDATHDQPGRGDQPAAELLVG
jgi:membrane-associated phospholipid phosphatase